MPDIIEQLEAGKKLQEEGIDVDSLRTKIGSEEETAEKPKSKRGRKKKEQPKVEEEQAEEKSLDPFEQAEKLTKELESEKTSKSDVDNDVKEEKYPGFDFNNLYTVGQTIYYVKLNNLTGDKDFMELKIRTIYPKFMVACTEKAGAQCLGADVQDYIFSDRYTAVECYNNVKLQQHVFVKDDLGDIELNTEE